MMDLFQHLNHMAWRGGWVLGFLFDLLCNVLSCLCVCVCVRSCSLSLYSTCQISVERWRRRTERTLNSSPFLLFPYNLVRTPTPPYVPFIFFFFFFWGEVFIDREKLGHPPPLPRPIEKKRMDGEGGGGRKRSILYFPFLRFCFNGTIDDRGMRLMRFDRIVIFFFKCSVRSMCDCFWSPVAMGHQYGGIVVTHLSIHRWGRTDLTDNMHLGEDIWCKFIFFLFLGLV